MGMYIPCAERFSGLCHMTANTLPYLADHGLEMLFDVDFFIIAQVGLTEGDQFEIIASRMDEADRDMMSRKIMRKGFDDTFTDLARVEQASHCQSVFVERFQFSQMTASLHFVLFPF